MTAHTIIYSGATNPPQTQSLRNQLAFLCQPQNQTTELLMVFSSYGGSTYEVRTLYGLLRTMPFPVHIHAIGTVQSAALQLMLAADHRTAAPDTEFLFHEWVWSVAQHPGAVMEGLQQTVIQLDHEVKWGRKILTERTKLTDADIDALKLFESTRIENTDFAIQYGLIDQAAELKIPANTMTWNIVG